MVEPAQAHIIVSDVSVRSSAFTPGERVRVLYLGSDPENARIDAFSPLWLSSLIPGIVGAVFSGFPALILMRRMRRGASGGPALSSDS